MAVSDKTVISDVIGTGDPWIYQNDAETIYSDAGPGYIHAAYRTRRCRAPLQSYHAACRKTFRSRHDQIVLQDLRQALPRAISRDALSRTSLRRPTTESGARASVNVEEMNRLLVEGHRGYLPQHSALRTLWRNPRQCLETSVG